MNRGKHCGDALCANPAIGIVNFASRQVKANLLGDLFTCIYFSNELCAFDIRQKNSPASNRATQLL